MSGAIAEALDLLESFVLTHEPGTLPRALDCAAYSLLALEKLDGVTS